VATNHPKVEDTFITYNYLSLGFPVTLCRGLGHHGLWNLETGNVVGEQTIYDPRTLFAPRGGDDQAISLVSNANGCGVLHPSSLRKRRSPNHGPGRIDGIQQSPLGLRGLLRS
jgi:hypothetical protein